MTLDQILAQARAALSAKLAERKQLNDSLMALRSGAEAGDVTVTDEKVRAAIEARAAKDAEVDVASARVAELVAEKAREDALGVLQREVGSTTPAPAYDAVIRTGDVTEARTYTAHAARTEARSFFTDAYNARERDDYQARERLQRHSREVTVHGEVSERALATGGAAGLVVPQYLVDLAAPVLRTGRPTANICNPHELPAQGMTLTVPRGTTGAATAIQATENSALQNTDEVWANLNVPVATIGGQQQVSRQLLERGAGMDAIIYQDLVKAWAANLDTQVLSGTGSSGQMLGILSTSGIGAATAFGAAATVANVNLKIAGGLASVFGAGAGIQARVLIMSPRRWGWFLGQVDASGRPVVVANNVANFNAAAVVTKAGADSADDGPIFVGTHSSGLPILVDPNVPTAVGTNSEDIVIVADNAELHLWEDGAPKELRFEQTLGGSLTTTLAVYGYAAFTAGRYPTAVAKVGGLDASAGNGLIAPAF